MAIGGERYVPYRERKPLELLTQSHAILGFNQCSLAKYLFIVAREDEEELKAHNIEDYFKHLLERVDLARDLHFHTQTSMDTLDYSSEELNRGSKLVIAACGEKKRELSTDLSKISLLVFWQNPKIVAPGILALEQKTFVDYEQELRKLSPEAFVGFPLLVLVDDSEFVSRSFDNFLWVTFTRSNPSHDVYGIQRIIVHKHWGCRGSFLIDARIKNHAPLLKWILKLKSMLPNS